MIENLSRKNNRFFLGFIFILFVGCNNSKNKTNEIKDVKIKKVQLSPSNSSKCDTFLNIITHISELTLPQNYKAYNKCVEFDNAYHSISKSCNLKINKSLLEYNNDSLSHKHDNDFYNIDNQDKTYYPIFKYSKLDKIIVVGFFVEYWLQDRKGVLIQLNSYDYCGKLIDFLIIYNRYIYESPLYHYNFEIDELFNLNLEKITENHYKYDKKSDIIGDRDKPIINKEREIYRPNEKGMFELTKK